MKFNQEPQSWAAAQAGSVSVDAGMRSYMLGVYNYMASALVLTGVFAWAGANFAPVMQMLYRVEGDRLMGMTPLGWIVAFAPLLFIFALNMGINRLSFGKAQLLFWAFAAVMGLSMSSLFFLYTATSMARVFFITSIAFGGLSLYGYTTKKNLTGMGSFLIMGLWGLFAASIVNIFLGSSGLGFAISILGVGIFAGLTAYDTQRLKTMYYEVQGNAENTMKVALLGALSLYLDFINLFMMLLRLTGDRR